ncbi:hypothetical protein R1flu_021432 [Riccia fluitans]|uniref:Uncharacterized protein n=1 Tax=Riccia fluitans TaxID=41844 RepID=A0ABD1ZSI4_9MARC
MSEDCTSDEEKLEAEAQEPNTKNVTGSEVFSPAEDTAQVEEKAEDDENMEDSEKDLLATSGENGKNTELSKDTFSLAVQAPEEHHPESATDSMGNKVVNNALFSPEALITAKKRGFEDKTGNRRYSIHHANAQTRLFASEDRETNLPAAGSLDGTGRLKLLFAGPEVAAKSSKSGEAVLKTIKKKKLKNKSK